MPKCPTTKHTSALRVLLVNGIDILPFKSFITMGLSYINAETRESVTYEELAHNCSERSASLFILYSPETNVPLGFFVLSIIEEMGDISVDISAAFSMLITGNLASYFSLQKAIDFGIMVSAKEITFSSPRKGAGRLAMKLGFSLINKVNGISHYSKDIKHGRIS